MKEYVYLPDRNHISDGPSLMLSQFSKQFGTLGISARAQTDPSGPLAMDADTVPLSASPGLDDLGALPLSVLDWVPQTGATQVMLNIGDNDAPPKLDGGAFHPVVEYEPATPLRVRAGRRTLALSQGPYDQELFKLKIALKPRGRGRPRPLAGAIVNLRPKFMPTLPAVTDEDGIAQFALRKKTLQNASLAVETGFNNHWGCLIKSIDLNMGDEIPVEPVNLSARPCALRLLAGDNPGPAGAGLKIAVIDSGVGPHKHLRVAGDEDNSMGHGTHVAGIIAGRGPGSHAGLAPDAEIFSYRVFNDEETGRANNFEIHHAIIRAVDEGCDLINLSLRVKREDEAVVGAAIEAASAQGVLCFAAAGNDRARRPITFPAKHPDCIAVAALGHMEGMPEAAFDRWTVSSTRSSANRSLFFGSFSNKGDQQNAIDIIAPGAGIISTVPGHNYAPMSGTSMACPAAVGAAARWISSRPDLLNAPRNRARRDQFWAFVKSKCSPLGFSQDHEGLGMIGYEMSG